MDARAERAIDRARMPAIGLSPVAARWLVPILTAAFVLMVGIYRPLHNWDMIGYVASAYKLDGYSGQALSDMTFGDIRSEVSDDTFETLTKGEGPFERNYRETVYRDPNALSQQIPFYSIRMAYVGLVRLVGRLGLSYSKTTYIISAIFSGLAVIALGEILAASEVHLATLPIVALASGIAQLSRSSGPDSLAIFFSFLCILALIKGNPTSFALAVALPLMRTDYVLISALALSYEFIRGRRIAAVISTALAAIAYIAINRSAGNYGWLTLLHIAEINLTPYPATLTPSTHPGDYANAYIFSIYNLISGGYVLIYLLATILLFTQRPTTNARSLKSDQAPDDLIVPLYVIPILYAALHILLFPHYEARFFIFSTALVSVWILSRLRPARALGQCAPARAG